MTSKLAAGPVAIGLKVTVIVQLELTGSAEPQLLACAKGPLAVIDEKFTVPTFVFVRVTVCAALCVPTGRLPKARDTADKVTPGLRIVNCKLAEWVSVEPNIPVTVTGKTPPGVPTWVLIVIIDVTMLVPVVTLGGEKLQVDILGSPAQERETEFPKIPARGLMDTGTLIELPATRLEDPVEREIEKSVPKPSKSTE